MYQSLSSSKSHILKYSPACPEDTQTKMKKKILQQKQRARSPFQDLNNAATDISSNASSVSSIEAPKGCLRFFLSHTPSSSSNKTHCSVSNGNHGLSRTRLLSTPKSATNMRPAKENSSKRFIFHKPISQKLEKCKKSHPEPRRKTGSRNAKISNVLNSSGSYGNKLKSDSSAVEQVAVGGVSDFDGSNLTPVKEVTSLNLFVENGVVNEGDKKSRISCNSNTKSTSSNTKTPPVQASVSPEIQCVSSMVTTAAQTITPVCYGAGCVMSGVTDKRKCRPRGILTIGEAKPLNCFDCDDETEEENGLGHANCSDISALPLPSEASMHWLLSPCNEEDKDKKEDSGSELFGFSRLEDHAAENFPALSSPPSNIFSPNVCLNNTDKVFSAGSCRGKELCSALLSPRRVFMGPPLYDKAGILGSEEEKKNCSDLTQFSPASFSSGNVIETPKSDCSSDRPIGISWLETDSGRKNLNFDCKINSIAERIQMASLSPKSYVSIWDPAGSSFQFDCLSSTSNSLDISHFQKVLDDQTSWLSNSTMENVSQSQMRISWREGLVSRMFEMDGFDSCPGAYQMQRMTPMS